MDDWDGNKRGNTVLRENLAGIKFGDFSQNAVFFNLANFKFGDLILDKNDIAMT